MHVIVPLKFWIGHAGDGRDAKSLFANGIRAVVDLALEEPAAQLPRELIYVRVPLLDGGGNDLSLLKLAVSMVVTFLQYEVAVLVCCGAGMSRSPAIAAFALAQRVGKTPLHCLNDIRVCRQVDLSPALWNDLERAMS